MNQATPQSTQQKKNVSQTAKAFAAQNPTSGLAPFTIRRRVPEPQDVQIDILYCGVCHSDLHQARNEWQKAMPTTYPVRPGARDRRPGRQNRERGDEVQSRRSRRRRLHGGLLPHLRLSAAPVKSSIATASPRSPTTAKTNTWAV